MRDEKRGRGHLMRVLVWMCVLVAGLIVLGRALLMAPTLRVEWLEEGLAAKAAVRLTVRRIAARASKGIIPLVAAAVAVRIQGPALPYQTGHLGRMIVREEAGTGWAVGCSIHFVAGISGWHPGTAARQHPCLLGRHPSYWITVYFGLFLRDSEQQMRNWSRGLAFLGGAPHETLLHQPPLAAKMLGRQIKHPPSTNFDLDSDSVRSVKRLKRVESGESLYSSAALSEDGDVDPVVPGVDDTSELGQTSLETALPLVGTDKGSIEEYETTRTTDIQRRLGASKSRVGRTSIYVDAFNHALEMVLKDESHLFDESESAIFKSWVQLNYEAQYLCVCFVALVVIPAHDIDLLGRLGL
jgi:hypothetical protein